jgi:hypothetical protein
MSDRVLEQRAAQFTVNKDGSFAGGNQSAYRTVRRELERRASRELASQQALKKTEIQRTSESPTAGGGWDIHTPRTEVFDFKPIETSGRADRESGEGGGAALPSGSAGDILYHNGTNWVVLARPTGKRVLMINGGNPFWEETEAC